MSGAQWGAVAGVLQRGESILLVREQGPDENEPHWALPGGVIEPGESIIQALRRELREEAGIALQEVGPLLYTSEIYDEAFDNRRFLALVFTVAAWKGEARASRWDSMVLEAAFVPKSEAASLISRRPRKFRFIYEPLVDWLQGKYESGAFYQYRIKRGVARKMCGPA